MANLDDSLKQAMEINGAVGVALVDFGSGMTLGTQGGGGLDLEVAAAGNTEVVRAKMATMKALGLGDNKIEDILITLTDQYHLIRLLAGHEGLFMYLALSRANSNLAMARRSLSDIEAALEF